MKGVSKAILAIYIVALFFVTFLTRKSTGRLLIQTEWFWGYKVKDPIILYGDNLINILLYIPIGCLVSLIAPKHKMPTAVLVGLFLSETIECSQLIWQRGTFDVDDLFNNTLGTLLGSLIVVLAIWIREKRKERGFQTPFAK